MNRFTLRRAAALTLAAALSAAAPVCAADAADNGAAAGPAAAAVASTAVGTANTDLLGSVGIGVRDLKASTEFYVAVLGLRELRRYELGYINEVVLGYPDGDTAKVVLMNWPNDTTRRYDGNDVKLVFYVSDPAAVLARIKARGGKVDREAAPIEVLNGRIVGLGRDPDNYVIEVLQSTP